MTEDEELLKKRLLELGKKSYECNIFCFTDFLGLAEQSVFSQITSKLIGVEYKLFGGAEGAERVMIRFGSEEECGYSLPFPIVCLRVAPKSPKFADKLTHRDFLGAILNLGIERSTLGDIVIRENVGYIFATEEIAKYIEKELLKIKRTDVTVTEAEEIPSGELYKTERKAIQVASERIDAVIAKVYNLSRDEAQQLFPKKMVYIDGKLTESPSKAPKAGEKISVRGYGRFIYQSGDSFSKKGKLNALVDVYV